MKKMSFNAFRAAAAAAAALSLSACATTDYPSLGPDVIGVNAAPTGQYIQQVPFFNRYYDNSRRTYEDVFSHMRDIVPNGNRMPSRIFDCWMGTPVKGPLLFDPQSGAPTGFARQGTAAQQIPCPGFGYNMEGVEYGPRGGPR